MKTLSTFLMQLLAGLLLVRQGYSVVAAEPAPLKAGEARIWYLGHCGYAVKTKSKLLIFDYSKKLQRKGEAPLQPPAQPSLGKGWIDPGEIKDLDVLVFVTHGHDDHFDEAIKGWEKTILNIHYVYGWDVGGGPRIHSLAGPRGEAEFEGLKVFAVTDHHDDVSESAFLVQVDGLTIYHNGDYIGKMAPDGPFRYVEDMQYLKAKAPRVDIFFTGAGTFEPYPQLIRALEPKVLFPMHYANREEKYIEFAAALGKLGIGIPVQCPKQPGDR